MFRPNVRKTPARSALTLLEVIFHASVRTIRKSHRNAAFGLVMNMIQSAIFVAIFLLTFYIIGIRTTPLRGDFMLYIMTGVFMYMTHIKAIGAVSGAETSTSQMMKHAPMNTIVSISAAALSRLYTQVLSAMCILFLYHTVWTPITIDQPVGALCMLLLSWISGCAIGMIFMAARPVEPGAGRYPRDGLPAPEHDRLRQDVSGQCHAAARKGVVRLESALPHDRPDPGLRLSQLQPASQLDPLPRPGHARLHSDWPDGRVLHAQARLRQLEREGLIRRQRAASG